MKNPKSQKVQYTGESELVCLDCGTRHPIYIRAWEVWLCRACYKNRCKIKKKYEDEFQLKLL